MNRYAPLLLVVSLLSCARPADETPLVEPEPPKPPYVLPKEGIFKGELRHTYNADGCKWHVWSDSLLTAVLPTTASQPMIDAFVKANGGFKGGEFKEKVSVTYRATGVQKSPECFWGMKERFGEADFLAITQ